MRAVTVPKSEIVLCRGPRGVSSFAVRTLRKLLDRDPLSAARALVLVPTAAAAHLFRRQVEDGLLSRRSALALPSITTPRDLVQTLAERTEGRIRLVDPLLREALLERAFRRAEEQGDPPPFLVRSGLARHVLQFHDALRLRSGGPDGIDGLASFFARAGEELDDPEDEGARKLEAQTRFLEVSLEGYRHDLAQLSLVDPPGARERLREEILPFERALVLGSDTLELLDLELLGNAPGLEEILLVVSESAAELPEAIARRFKTIRAAGEERPGPPRFLLPAAGETAFLSRDREETLTDVARLLKRLEDDGRLPPLHRVAVVVPRPLPYLYLAKKVFAEAGIPYQLQDSFPLAAEPFVAATDVAIELVAARAHRAASLALLRSPFFSFPGVSGLEVAAFDEYTLRYREPGGIDRWRYLRERLARLPEQPMLPGIDGFDREARALPAVRALVAASQALSPLADTGPLTGKVECLLRYLSDYGRIPASPSTIERSLRARQAFLSILERLADAARRVDDPPIDFGSFRDKLRRAIESHTFALRTGETGIQIVDARSAPFGAFDLVLLLGLNEGEWPVRSERNIFYPPWLLKDFGWPSDREHLASERRKFLDLLELGGKHVALFRHEIEDEVPTVPSPFLDEARSFTIERDVPEARLNVELDDLVVTRSEALEHRLVAPDWGHDDAPASGAAGRIEGPLQVPEPISPTAVELFLRCPFKYFSRYLLGLEEEEDIDETLSALDRGRIVHEILQEGFSEWDRGRETPRPIDAFDYDEALALFRRIALSKIPPGHRAIEIHRLFGGVGEPGPIPWLLRREMARGAPRQRLLEHSFQSPLRFEIGPRGEKPWFVRIKGRVDRADVDRDGLLHVFDYKSGRAPSEEIALQVPLYAMALSQELGVAVREAAYLSLRDRKAASRADFAKAQDLLLLAVDAIGRGRFGPRPYQEHLCGSCGYLGVCRKQISESEAL
jgi:hypothetical protein